MTLDMIIAADETGSFRDSTKETLALVTLVTITDVEWIRFFRFMTALFPQGFKGIKGHNLNPDQRKKILRYIGRKPSIKYTCFLYDLRNDSDKWVTTHKEGQLQRIEESIKNMGDKLKPSYIADLKLHMNQVRRYSIADYSKFVLYTELLIAWQQFFLFDYIFIHTKNDSWRMHHIWDSQNEPNKFLRLVRNTMILTTNEQNPNYSIFTPKEWGKNHPFLIYHAAEGDINRQDGSKFYEDVIIGNEKSDERLFLPDFIGYIIYSSILNNEQRDWLVNLKQIWQNRSYTITSKHPSGYYHITSFDKSRNPKDVNPLIRSHWQAMKKI